MQSSRDGMISEDRIRYDMLAQDALRGVIKTVLTRVRKSGLPGEHHFYIAFDTNAEGVSLSKRLREQYADEMTIVLQYQFWDLHVSDDRFEVKLSFNNMPERLVVPYSAIKAFFDPSVQFGLQFGSSAAANDATHGRAAVTQDAGGEEDTRPVKPARAKREPSRALAPRLIEDDDTEDDVLVPAPKAAAGKVVELDRFRRR